MLFRAISVATFLFATLILAAEEPKKEDPKTLVQSDDGTILLHSKDVIIHGTTVRYEPQPHKNTVGFWTKQEDWVSWKFTVKTPGTFTVEMMQGCGKDNGGSEYEVSVGEQKIKAVVEETGGWQNFVLKEIGTLTIEKAGDYEFNVKPLSKKKAAVMDLRQVTLKPVKK